MGFYDYIKRLKKNEKNVDREDIKDIYPDCKIYFNGDHYIAIPHTTRRVKKRPKKKEFEFVVRELDGKSYVGRKPTLEEIDCDDEEYSNCPFEGEIEKYWEDKKNNSPNSSFNADMVPSNEDILLGKVKEKKTRTVTRASEFARLYADTTKMRRGKKIQYILKDMLPFFQNREAAKHYVTKRVDDKYRAANTRCERFKRKADNYKFDYFATFTYDGKKLTEEEFEKKLSETLRHFATRRGWRYMGVWERGGMNERLHFHCILKIPEGEMIGDFEKLVNYSFKHHDTRKVLQNSFFRDKFGLNEFSKLLDQKVEYSRSINYILKYVTKYDAKVVSSRGLPMYFKGSIFGEDVALKTGAGYKKLLISDKTKCYNEDGEYLGTLDDENTKNRMKHLSS